jgi:beta-lactamase superfamily II metal-dependent hydrolase
MGAAFLSMTGFKEARSQEEGFVLWQLPPQTKTQMNSYVIRTSGGKIVVIDGGNEDDSHYLKGFLGVLGDHVHHWFISHPHSDHLDALTAILKEPAMPKIDAIHGSFPSHEWIARYEPGEEKSLVSFTEACGKKGLTLHEHDLGEVMIIDGIRFEILGIKNPEITRNPVNNSSVLMLVSGSGKTILFPGDLGVEGGEKASNSPFRKKLRAEYVQMAHHGQNGVGEEFYQEVQPLFCLWPTPDWLWDNDNGGGKGSGPWVTITVRGWMEKLGVKKHYVAKDGLARIE